MSAKYFAFDVETTGLDPSESEIIALAAVLLDRNFEELQSINVYAMPEKGCPPEAARINGFSEELWTERGAVSQSDLYAKLAGFVKGTWRLTPVGHNVSFDVGFLKALYARFADKTTFDNYYSWHTVDTLGSSILLDVAKHGGKGGSYSLGKLCERYGISLGEEAHDAKADIRATIELFKYITLAIRGDAEIVPPKHESYKKKVMLELVDEQWKFNKGKYAGHSLAQVKSLEHDYLRWMLREYRDISDEAREAIKAVLQ